MQTVFHDHQRAHDPRNFLAAGTPRPNPEQPARIDALLGAVSRLGLPVSTPADSGLGPIAAVHSAEYISFLRRIHGLWAAVPGASEEVIPNIHPGRWMDSYPDSAVGLAGYHMADTACPISADTFHSAYWSAQTALSGAAKVLAGEGPVYALSRPPGHHAFADMAGGFCFFNNSAIAAQAAVAAGRRVAILDIDLHHGNGTQGIFYRRGDVLTVSIHADPVGFYPFFMGHAQERGAGDGLGANLNLPLPRGTADEGMLRALDLALGRVADFGCDFLVVALGLDAFEGDPLTGLGVTTPGFARLAGRIAGLGLPTLLVQEGGYLCPELGDNLESFLSGFAAAG